MRATHRWTPVLFSGVLVLAGCDDGRSGSGGHGRPPDRQAPRAQLSTVTAAGLPAMLHARREPSLLLSVWSTWCEPCVEEFPQLVALGKEFRDDGLGLVLISTDAPARRSEVLAFLNKHGAPFPSYLKTGSDTAFVEAVHSDWSGTLPATVLLDRDRNAVAFWEGSAPVEELRRSIRYLLAQAADPPSGSP